MKREKNNQDEFDKFHSIIEQNEKFIVMGHINPEGDCIGSTLAVAIYLKKLNKKVIIYNESSTPDNLKFLPFSNEIVHEISDINGNICILVDCGDLARVGKIKDEIEKSGVMVVNIDHHRTNTQFGKINIVDESASAAGEIVYRFLKYIKFPIDVPIAQNIYCTILTDTGSFRYSNSTKEAFVIASELIDLGVKPWEIAQNLYETQPLGKIQLLKMILSTLDVQNGFAAIMVLREMLEKTGTNSGDIDGFINYARSINGIEVAIQFRELDENIYKVSFRSKGKIDVSKIALSFGGGGHKNAAACLLKNNIEEAKKIIFDRVKNELFNVHITS